MKWSNRSGKPSIGYLQSADAERCATAVYHTQRYYSILTSSNAFYNFYSSKETRLFFFCTTTSSMSDWFRWTRIFPGMSGTGNHPSHRRCLCERKCCRQNLLFITNQFPIWHSNNNCSLWKCLPEFIIKKKKIFKKKQQNRIKPK